MGTDGACGLLFCAAKRSGAFPPNMPAGLRARVSRLGGFRPANASDIMLAGVLTPTPLKKYNSKAQCCLGSMNPCLSTCPASRSERQTTTASKGFQSFNLTRNHPCIPETLWLVVHASHPSKVALSRFIPAS
jgi:hypothetical protein